MSHPLGRNITDLNARYLGPEGDALAIEELAPVARRFTSPGARVLEVGCGYGRNLVALATVPHALLAGCDVSAGELGTVLGHPGGAPRRAAPARVYLIVTASGNEI